MCWCCTVRMITCRLEAPQWTLWVCGCLGDQTQFSSFRLFLWVSRKPPQRSEDRFSNCSDWLFTQKRSFSVFVTCLDLSVVCPWRFWRCNLIEAEEVFSIDQVLHWHSWLIILSWPLWRTYGQKVYPLEYRLKTLGISRKHCFSNHFCLFSVLLCPPLRLSFTAVAHWSKPQQSSQQPPSHASLPHHSTSF